MRLVRALSADPASPAFFWRFNLAVWTIFAVFEYGARVAVFADPGRALVMTLVQEPIGFALSYGLYFIYRKIGVGERFEPRTAVWIVTLSLGAGIIQASICRAIIEINDWHMVGWSNREEWLIRIIFITLVYLAWSLVYFGLVLRAKANSEGERARRAGEEAQRMELQLLRAQLDPHFLFNSLNGIAAEIEPHPKAALEMVRELSDYLRYSLDHRHRVATPLSTELDAMSAYLRIEQTRFEERLSASVEASPEARRQQVPSFLLQPLVENAVKHGMRAEVPSWELRIAAEMKRDTLHITVANSGHLVAKSDGRVGVGLETLRRRLDLHYPGRHYFDLAEKAGLVEARLELQGDPCFA